MDQPDDISVVAAEFRRHYDQYYLGVIPRLLNEEGLILAFVSLLTAIECLAGAYRPKQGSGERFQKFVKHFFPAPYHSITDQLWQFRNRMIHSFNPTPFVISCHQSRMHLASANGIAMLNVEDFYADVLIASRGYFSALYSEPDLQTKFAERMGDGGRIKPLTIVESVNAPRPAI